jgi:tetratricopeptide (TPR) repeat protein
MRSRTPLVAVLLAVLVAGSVALQAARDRAFPRTEVADRFLYLESGETLKRLALSLDAVAADVYWIRTLQHFGGDRLSRTRQKKYELLHPLLDLTTTLDPEFTVAYRFGAIFLAEPYPGGPGRPDQAIALLQKGLRYSPQKWEYMQDIAFVYYWELGDFREAAAWFQRAGRVPGAPAWLDQLAATMLAQGGDRASSRFLWHQIAESAEEPWLKGEAQRRLAQLAAMDEIDWLQQRVAVIASTEPEEPLTWERLVRARVLRDVPLDPAGVPYELNPWWGSVSVSPESRLWPMPTGERVRVGLAR